MAESGEINAEREDKPAKRKRQQRFVFKFNSLTECKESEQNIHEPVPTETCSISPPKSKNKKKKAATNSFVFKFKPTADSFKAPDEEQSSQPIRKTVVPKRILDKVEEDVRKKFSEKNARATECKSNENLEGDNANESKKQSSYYQYEGSSEAVDKDSRLPVPGIKVTAEGHGGHADNLTQAFSCFESKALFDESEALRKESHIEEADLLQELPYFGNEAEDSIVTTQIECKAKKKRKKRGKMQKDHRNSGERRKLPNYFISLPITNPRIHEDIMRVQSAVVEAVPELQGACIKCPKLHVTLMVLHIDGEEQLRVGQKALEQCKDALREFMDPALVLHVHGVSHFRNAVLYADLLQNEQLDTLKRITQKVREIFQANKLESLDDRFTPHVTILKLSKLKREKGAGRTKKIPDSAFEAFVGEEFGEQVVKNLKLCAMLKPKAEDGGYHVDAIINLVPEEINLKAPSYVGDKLEETSRRSKECEEANEASEGHRSECDVRYWSECDVQD